MTEDEGRDWIERRFGRAGLQVMERIVAIVETGSATQNLVAVSTLSSIWTRHIVDSAQLLDRAGVAQGIWIDIGSGAGFPGLVVAALSDFEVRLVEPRARRASFLKDAVASLGIADRTRVVQSAIAKVTEPATVISARAVASLGNVLEWGQSCATPVTRWLLPKGRSATEEIADATQTWHGTFHVEHSITDPASLIVIASGVSRR